MESHTLSPRRQLYDKGLRVVLYFCEIGRAHV